MNKMKDSISAICKGVDIIQSCFYFSPLDYQKDVLQNAIAFLEGKSDFKYKDQVNDLMKLRPFAVLTNEAKLFVLNLYLGYINGFKL